MRERFREEEGMDIGEKRNNSMVGREISLVREKVGLGRF
jgi:hypothetical protein